MKRHDKQAAKCEQCGCPQLRETTVGEAETVDPKAIEHLIKKVDRCIKYRENKAGGKDYHPLDIKVRFDKRINQKVPERSFIIRVEYCGNCGYQYTHQLIPTERRDLLEYYHQTDVLETIKVKTP